MHFRTHTLHFQPLLYILHYYFEKHCLFIVNLYFLPFFPSDKTQKYGAFSGIMLLLSSDFNQFLLIFFALTDTGRDSFHIFSTILCKKNFFRIHFLHRVQHFFRQIQKKFNFFPIFCNDHCIVRDLIII